MHRCVGSGHVERRLSRRQRQRRLAATCGENLAEPPSAPSLPSGDDAIPCFVVSQPFPTIPFALHTQSSYIPEIRPVCLPARVQRCATPLGHTPSATCACCVRLPLLFCCSCISTAILSPSTDANNMRPLAFGLFQFCVYFCVRMEERLEKRPSFSQPKPLPFSFCFLPSDLVLAAAT